MKIYQELKTWQQGIGAFLALIGLVIAAHWNFRLNRKRDAALRDEESKSVAAALYGEIRLLRDRAAAVARAVASLHIEQGLNGKYSMKFDKHFAEAWSPPVPTIYRALAPKFGLLPSWLILQITEFYDNIETIRMWISRLGDDHDRGYSYGPLYVLHPARDAAEKSESLLRRIEELLGIPEHESAKALDLGKAYDVIAWEEENARAAMDVTSR